MVLEDFQKLTIPLNLFSSDSWPMRLCVHFLCVCTFLCANLSVCALVCLCALGRFLSHLVPTLVCKLCWAPLLPTLQDAPESNALDLRMSYGMCCYGGPRQTPSHPAKSGQSFVTGVMQVPLAYLCLWQHYYFVYVVSISRCSCLRYLGVEYAAGGFNPNLQAV